MNEILKNKIQKLWDETPETVTSVSYGKKITNGQKTNDLAVIFTVNKKLSVSDLKPDEILPNNIVCDGQSYLTDVVEGNVPNLMTCYTNVNDQNIQRLRGNPSLLRPMRGGQEIIQFPTGWSYSGGWGYYLGTLGFFAVDNIDNRVVGVTNSHVVCYKRIVLSEQNQDAANADPYNIVDDITWAFNGNGYPAGALSINGNTLNYSCLYIKKFRSVSNSGVNYVDGALMLMNNPATPYVNSNSYQIWQRVDDPDYLTHMPFATSAEIDNLLSTNPYVYSTGRTTGPKGYAENATCTLRITQIAVNTYVSSDEGLQNWADCLRFEYEDGSVDPVAGGDSGSALLANIGGVRKIIGLVFAGSSAGRYGLANRIDRVASELNIRAWDASYTADLSYPTLEVLSAPRSMGYGNIQSFVLNNKTYFAAGYSQNYSIPTLPPVPSNTPTSSYTPVPTPTETPLP